MVQQQSECMKTAGPLAPYPDRWFRFLKDDLELSDDRTTYLQKTIGKSIISDVPGVADKTTGTSDQIGHHAGGLLPDVND